MPVGFAIHVGFTIHVGLQHCCRFSINVGLPSPLGFPVSMGLAVGLGLPIDVGFQRVDYRKVVAPTTPMGSLPDPIGADLYQMYCFASARRLELSSTCTTLTFFSFVGDS